MSSRLSAKNAVTKVAIKLEKHINLVKYTLFCVNVIIWILGGFLAGLCISLRMDTGLQERLEILEIWEFYIGVYMLLFAAVIILAAPILACYAGYQEIIQLLLINGALHAFCFLLLTTGIAVLLENSSYESGIRNSIREALQRLIENSYYSYNMENLNRIQEDIGCCGADGPNDYISMRRPLPNECRDTVTGNAYFHSCTDEVTWYLEDNVGWLAGIAYTLSALHMLTATLSLILVQALRKEEKISYKR